VLDDSAKEDQVHATDPVLHVVEVRGATIFDPRLQAMLPDAHAVELDSFRVDVEGRDGRAWPRGSDAHWIQDVSIFEIRSIPLIS
jgi:hypothetical protein